MNGHSLTSSPNPQAQLALNRLSALHPVLYEVIELSIEHARTFFEEDGRAFDSYTFSHLVRYHIWNHLNSGTYSHVGYHLSKLANTGLEVRHAGCVIKIWKAEEGEIPSPGDSEGRKQFLTQPQQPLFPELFHQPMGVSAKLAVVWDVSVSLGMTCLDLVCPSGFESEWKSGEAHWTVPIPDPATQIQADQSFESDDDDLDIPLEDTGEDDDDN